MTDKILIVDDSVSMRQMVNFTMTDAGFTVIEACDGQDGLAKFAADIKLVITDLNMPGMNGIELIKAIRGGAVNRYVPVLMLTTESEAGRKQEGKAAGATGWIVKPFTPEALVATAKKLVGG